MQIRITLSNEELDRFFDPGQIIKKYNNRDGSIRIYFNSVEELQKAALSVPGSLTGSKE